MTGPGRRRLAAAVVGGCISFVAVPITPPSDAQARTPDESGPIESRAADRTLDLVEQQFAVAPDAPLTLTVVLPSDVDPTEFDDAWSIVVSAHQPLLDRTGFREALGGDAGPAADSVRLSLDPTAAEPRISSSTAGTLTVTVPTETTVDTTGALQFSRPGVRALTVDVRDGSRSVASLATFVVATNADAPQPAEVMPVSLVMRQTTAPVVELDGSVSASDDAIAELDALRASLAALDAAELTIPGGSVAVMVEPATLRAVFDTRPEPARALLTLLADSDLLAAPRLPLDPSSAAQADRADTYTQLLREGEDLLTELLPSTVIDRTVDLVDSPISAAGALLQRNLGTRLMVMPYRLYESLPGSLGGFTDTTQLIDVALGDGSTVPSAIIDPDIAASLTDTTRPVGTAIDITAELMVIAGQIDRTGAIVARHGMVLGVPDLGVIDAALLEHLAPLLTTTPGLRLTSLGEMSATVDRLLLDGTPVVVGLPAVAGPDLTTRFALTDDVADETVATASMLSTDEQRVASWVSTVHALPSTVIDDATAQAMAAALREQFQDVRDCVDAPDPYSFTLTGRNSVIPITVTNRCDFAVTVRLQLDSAKIAFPDGEVTVVLAPLDDTTERMRALARSNGKSSVFLRMFTPAAGGGQVVPEVVLTARVNSLAGVGQLLLGAGVLVVLAWWLRHWLDVRRRARTDEVAPRHPASGTGSSGPDA